MTKMPGFARSGLSPEIVHFKHPLDSIDPALAPGDWYVKGWQ